MSVEENHGIENDEDMNVQILNMIASNTVVQCELMIILAKVSDKNMQITKINNAGKHETQKNEKANTLRL